MSKAKLVKLPQTNQQGKKVGADNKACWPGYRYQGTVKGKMSVLKSRNKHLDDVDMSYLQHLYRAWTIAFVLLLHGLLPFIWQTKASDLLCQEKT